jgi:hypothetical protein
MDWRCGSSSRVPALQVQSPEFKLQYHENKTKKGFICYAVLNFFVVPILFVEDHWGCHAFMYKCHFVINQ